MRSTIPATTELRVELERLNTPQLAALAEASGVPFTTLWKIRDGTTKNPGIETVRKFRPHLPRAVKASACAPSEHASASNTRRDGPSHTRER